MILQLLAKVGNEKLVRCRFFEKSRRARDFAHTGASVTQKAKKEERRESGGFVLLQTVSNFMKLSEIVFWENCGT
jgi:hypothetical protein